MTDSDGPSDTNDESENTGPSWWQRIIEKPKTYLEKRRARQKQEKPEERYARKAATATVWMAIFTVVIAGVGVLQWRVLSGQLKVMQDAAPDTQKIIQANQNLAAAAKIQAENTGKLVDAANRSANAAEAAEGVAQEQLKELRAEQSPLIAVDNDAPTNTSPRYSTDPVPELAWNIAFTNIGKRAAYFDSHKIFMKVGESPFKCVKSCEETKKTRVNPGQHEYITGTWPMTQTEFDATMKMKEGAFIVVFFRYRDEAGSKYASDICMGHYSNGSLEDCAGVYRERDMK